MRLSIPRIPPLAAKDQSEEARQALTLLPEGASGFNLFTTVANHPKLARNWLTFGVYVLKTTLPPRHGEILILRTGWLCQSDYEFAQHMEMSKSAGLTEADFQRIVDGPDAAGWDPFEAALVRACDELHKESFVSDATWNALSAQYTKQQLMDLIFTVGQYHIVSMVLNTLGVQLDPGLEGYGRFGGR